MIDRRTLLGGLGVLLVAPSIVRASSLMHLSRVPVPRAPRIWYVGPSHELKHLVDVWARMSAGDTVYVDSMDFEAGLHIPVPNITTILRNCRIGPRVTMQL